MNRRGFLGSILALGAAPALVRASSLMPCAVRSSPYCIASIPLTIDDFTWAGRALDRQSGLLTIQQITREALVMLESNLTLAKVGRLRLKDPWPWGGVEEVGSKLYVPNAVKEMNLIVRSWEFRG